MEQISDYREALEAMENEPTLAGNNTDPTFALRILLRELRTALWQAWTQEEAISLQARAVTLLTALDGQERTDKWSHHDL